MAVSLRAIRPRVFRVIIPTRVDIEARAGMREYLDEVKKIMQDNYETARSSPGYTRTNRMRKGWKVRVPSNNFGDLINDVRYTSLVQGPNRNTTTGRVLQQARFRERGWLSISDVARDTKHRYERIMNRRIKSTLERR